MSDLEVTTFPLCQRCSQPVKVASWTERGMTCRACASYQRRGTRVRAPAASRPAVTPTPRPAPPVWKGVRV